MHLPIELKIKYLKRRLEDIAKLKSCVENEDYSFAQKVGHQVKGNAATFEVPEIAYLGAKLENAAIQKDKVRVKLLIHEMESYLITLA